MTKDEAYQEYEEALDKIHTQAHEATEETRAILQGRLKALRAEHHEELKAIRDISQKTRKGKKNG